MEEPGSGPELESQAEPIAITPDMLASAPSLSMDCERGISYRPVLTLLIIVLCATIFAWELSVGALESTEKIVEAGALHRGRILSGEVHRFISAMFLHGGFDHLIGNCLALYVVGMACQHAFGWKRMGIVFLLAGVAGGLLSIALHPGPSIGASGAVFGVLGALVGFFRRHRKRLHLRDKRIGFVLLFWALYQIGLGFVTPLVDNFAHLGGFASGLVLGWFLKPARLGIADSDRTSA